MLIESKFDLEDFLLSNLLSEVSIELDLLSQGRKLEEENYQKINQLATMLREKSRDFRKGNETNTEAYFFWIFYGERKEESNRYKVGELYANNLLVLSEELSIVKDLPQEKVKELKDVCVKFSKKARDYWNTQNPNGFKKY
jgi:hypothetical protein